MAEERTIHLTRPELDEFLNAAERTLATTLDTELYEPMKIELAKRQPDDDTHSLGQRKEQYKGTIERVFQELKDVILLRGGI